MPTRVVLIEDQPQTRQDVSRLLNSLPGIELAGTYPTAEAALEQIPARRIDLAIVDAVLPRMSGIDLIHKLRETRPSIGILVLTAYDDTERIFSALEAGADGYVLKSSLETALPVAIRDVLSGGTPLTPSVARKVIQHFRKQLPSCPNIASLTDRELAVLREVATGRTYDEIGQLLGISPETVRTHVRNAKKKLRENSRIGAAIRLLQG